MNHIQFDSLLRRRDILKQGFHIFFENFMEIAKFLLIVFLVTVLASPLPIINNVVNYLAMPFLVMGIAYMTNNVLSGQQIYFRDTLNISWSKFLDGCKTEIVRDIFLFGLMLLLLVPAVIYGVFWVFSVPITMLRDKSGLDAIKYSRELVRGKWLKVFTYLLVFAAIQFIFSMSIWSLIMPNAYNVLTDPFLSSLTRLLNWVLWTPFTVMTVILFLNLDSISPMAQEKGSVL